MRLSNDQVARYHEDGYLFFPALFSLAEIETVKEHLFTAEMMRTPGISLEEESNAARAMMGVHLYDSRLEQLTRHPRLLVPSLQLAGEELALLQSRVIVKSGIERRAHRSYPWHQDYSTWYLMEAKRAAADRDRHLPGRDRRVQCADDGRAEVAAPRTHRAKHDRS
jgi:ectoine hydroxylase